MHGRGACRRAALGARPLATTRAVHSSPRACTGTSSLCECPRRLCPALTAGTLSSPPCRADNKISDVGAVALAMTAATEEASPPFDRLREVWLSGGRINEKGVQALTYALQNGALPAIEELTLTSNPCSAKTMLAFQQQMDARKAGMTVVVSLEQLAKQFHNE
eukprot:3127219-Prymnesium_polylepis.2